MLLIIKILKRYFIYSVSIGLAIIYIHTAEAEEYLADTWMAEDGLPQNTVTCITQTRDGYIWLGTLNGIARFDGVRFVVFGAHNTPELKSNRITCLLEDNEGALWIGTEGGGVTRLSHGNFTTYTDWEGLPNNIVLHLSSEENGRVSIVTQAGTGVWQDGKLSKENINHRIPQQAVPEDHPLPDLEVQVTLKLSDGSIWAGTREGSLWRFVDSSWKRVVLPGDTGKHPVLTLFEDKENNLWVGTEGGGLIRIKPRRLMTLDIRDGLSNEHIMSMADDGNNGIWLASNGGGINHWYKGQVSAWPESGPLKDNKQISTLLRTSDGSLWIGTSGDGLYRWKNGETVRFGPSEGLPNPNILALFEDRDKRLWIGTYAKGIYLYKGGTFRNFGAQEGFPAQIITAIVQDRDGDMWIGSNGMGLYRYADNRFSYYCRREGWGSEYIQTLLVDKDGALWIGSGGSGITRMKDGWFHTLTTKEGLEDDVISQILEDEFGYLWLGSNRGILRMSKEAFDAYASGHASVVENQSYGKSEGLLSLECTGGFSPAGLKAEDGSLWFSTVKGAVRIEPSRMVNVPSANTAANSVLFNPLPPNVVIEEVFIDDQPLSSESAGIEPGRKVIIQPGQKSVDFRYTALSFTAPERIRFKYRLDGFDSGWISSGDNRLARYVKLPPGEFLFEVTACNNDGVWNQKASVIPVTVLPHFWQTKWFVIIIGLFVIAMVAGIVRAVVLRRMHVKLDQMRHKNALETDRKRIARDLHDDLGARLTKISLLTAIAESDLNTKDKTEGHINEIADAVHDMTCSLDEVVWAVEPGNDTLENLATYLSRYTEEFLNGAGIRCRLNIPTLIQDAGISSALRHDLFLVLKEALNNVVKHAQATTVRFSLNFYGNRLYMSIEDDGCGFDADTVQRGNGLNNMAQRVSRWKGEFAQNRCPEGGCRIIFSIPLEKRDL